MDASRSVVVPEVFVSLSELTFAFYIIIFKTRLIWATQVDAVKKTEHAIIQKGHFCYKKLTFKNKASTLRDELFQKFW